MWGHTVLLETTVFRITTYVALSLLSAGEVITRTPPAPREAGKGHPLLCSHEPSQKSGKKKVGIGR